jgi:hypothetical protein
MLTIFRFTSGVLITEWLPLHASFDIACFCEVIIPGVTRAVFSDQTRQRKWRVCVRMDKARPHSSKRSVQRLEDSKFAQMRHPLYSPDIAATGSLLFGTVRQLVLTCAGHSFEEVRDNIREILSPITRMN